MIFIDDNPQSSNDEKSWEVISRCRNSSLSLYFKKYIFTIFYVEYNFTLFWSNMHWYRHYPLKLFISAIFPFHDKCNIFYIWCREWPERDWLWNTYLQQKMRNKRSRRKGSIPRYQYFLNNKDGVAGNIMKSPQERKYMWKEGRNAWNYF